MTKTPEELTEDWKAGKLESGLYYVGNDKVKDFAFVKPHEIAVYTLDDNMPKILKRGVQILASVPTYEEYKAMQDQIADASKTIEALESRIDDLEKENKQLEEDTGYGWHTAGIESDKNDKLRGLLKDIKLFFEECNPHDFTIVADNMDIYLTRINAALGDNKTQANPVDNIKIQESEEK